jgi:glycosyltransferase involved in cell wall biosynthesis
MLAPIGGVSHVRVVEPMRALASDPAVRTQISNGRDVPGIPGDAPRIWIFHRPALTGADGLETVRALLRHRYLIVTEFDDHPDYIPILQRPDMWNFRAVHAVQTTTPELADILRRDNDEIAIFPNGVRMLLPPRNHAEPGRLRLFFGGLNREQDWPPYVEALNEVAAEAGDRLHFDIVHDQGLFDALETPHKSFSPMLDYAPYLERLARCDVSFMPLADTPFNRAKSDLKFLEAAAWRVCALASPVVYGASVQDGRTGLLFRDEWELREKLRQLVAQPEQALALGVKARAWVAENRMLAYQVASRVAWYRSLWARREELTRKLLERMPELAEG